MKFDALDCLDRKILGLIERELADGFLPCPSDMAGEIGIHMNAVAFLFRKLERAGFIRCKWRRGWKQVLPDPERVELLYPTPSIVSLVEVFEQIDEMKRTTRDH